MKRALATLALLACATPEVPRAPITPIAEREPPARELSYHPSRIFAAKEPDADHAQGTLVMAMENGDEHVVHRLDELDIGTMRVYRSLDFERTEFAAFERRERTLYVLTVTVSPKRGATHTLQRVDLDSLTITESVQTDGELASLHTEDAFRPLVRVGSRGVRVTFRGACPYSASSADEDGCIHYETHRLGDLAVTKIRVVPFAVNVPDDFGGLPPEPKPTRPRCATHGIFSADDVWVGDDHFALTFGCCGSPPGGFFECKATK